jgi:ABC-type dipeptide/oligopeptide/nickel transport system permease subunit
MEKTTFELNGKKVKYNWKNRLLIILSIPIIILFLALLFAFILGILAIILAVILLIAPIIIFRVLVMKKNGKYSRKFKR